MMPALEIKDLNDARVHAKRLAAALQRLQEQTSEEMFIGSVCVVAATIEKTLDQKIARIIWLRSGGQNYPGTIGVRYAFTGSDTVCRISP